MPGLKTTDDRTFVAAFQAIDRAIINPWFMLTGFLGALVFTGAATLLHLGRDPLPWIAAALVAYVDRVRDHAGGERAAQRRAQGRGQRGIPRARARRSTKRAGPRGTSCAWCCR